MSPKKPVDFASMVSDLRSLVTRIGDADAGREPRTVRKLREEIELIKLELGRKVALMDPILRPESIFDPSNPSIAGRVVALTMVAQARHPLASIPTFYGAGVYAIYYKGTFPYYAPLAGTDHPIYVGKADPSSPSAKDAIAQGPKLSVRLAEHAKSIGKAATTLDLDDFECRFLIVQTGFQKSAEDFLINFFKPIWNSETKICFGLGKHGDSATTRVNKRSPWDTLHPGRPWADNTTSDQKSAATILAELQAHFSRHEVFSDQHQIFERFMFEMRQLNTDHFYSLAQGHVAIDVSPDDIDTSIDELAVGLFD